MIGQTVVAYLRMLLDKVRYNQTVTQHDFEADLFRALSHPVRVRILDLLRAAGSLTVGEIQQRLGLHAANISQHLAVLRIRRIVSTRREGTSIWYTIAEPGLLDVLDAARRLYEPPPEPRRQLQRGSEQEFRESREIDN